MPTHRSLVSPGGGSNGGLERSDNRSGKSASWTFSFWAKWSPVGSPFKTLAASTTGQEQIYTGSPASRDVFTRIGNNTGGAGERPLSVDTWHHVHVAVSSSGGAIIVNNGTPDAIAGAVGELDDAAGWVFWLLQDDGADDDWDGRIFDFIAAEGVYDADPTNFNFSSANGGEWTDYAGGFGTYGFRIDGQSISDAGADSSGNGNHFIQSSGGGAVTLDDVDVPPGANPVGGALEGSASVTTAPDTITAAGSVTVTGIGSATSADDAATASGSVAIAGAAGMGHVPDTAQATGDILVAGELTNTLFGDNLAAAGDIPVTGSASVTTVSDTLDADGGFSGALTGTAAIASQDDAITAAGSVALTGTASPGGQADALSAQADVHNTGGALLHGQADTALAVGASLGGGVLASTLAGDAVNASALVAISGAASASLGPDTLVADGAVAITGAASIESVADALLATNVALDGDAWDDSSTWDDITTWGNAEWNDDAFWIDGDTWQDVNAQLGELLVTTQADTVTAIGAVRIVGTASFTSEPDTAIAAGVVTLGEFQSAPERTITLLAPSRVHVLEAESRTFVLPAQDRVITLAA